MSRQEPAVSYPHPGRPLAFRSPAWQFANVRIARPTNGVTVEGWGDQVGLSQSSLLKSPGAQGFGTWSSAPERLLAGSEKLWYSRSSVLAEPAT